MLRMDKGMNVFLSIQLKSPVNRSNTFFEIVPSNYKKVISKEAYSKFQGIVYKGMLCTCLWFIVQKHINRYRSYDLTEIIFPL